MGLTGRKDGRLHIETPLMGESLVSQTFLSGLDQEQRFRSLPELNVIKVGGQSIIDRGKAALLPIVKELARLAPSHQILVTTGGGTRARHVYSIALDLDLPTGILASLGGAVTQQNALILATLLAPHKGIKIHHGDLSKLPAYLALGCIPVLAGFPPYGLWEVPPKVGRIPPHRTDVGALLTAEVLGAKRCLFVKDEEGLYTDDPKKNPKADFIADIKASELLALEQDDLVIERAAVEILENAHSLLQVQIINGLKPDLIGRALCGEEVGSIIRRG